HTRSDRVWSSDVCSSDLGDPVMLDTEDDGVSRAGLGHTEKRSTDGTAKVPSGRSQRSVKISTECPEVRHQHSPSGNALTVRIGRSEERRVGKEWTCRACR